MARKPKVSVQISPEARERLRQIARENHASMTTTLIQMIYAVPLDHPEAVGQLRFKDLKPTGEKEDEK